MICIAALLSWAFTVAAVIAVQYGMGSHMDEVLKRGTHNLERYIQVHVHGHSRGAQYSLTPDSVDYLAVIHFLQRLSGLLEVIHPRILPSTW